MAAQTALTFVLKDSRPTELHLRPITGCRSKSPLTDDHLHNSSLPLSLRKLSSDLFEWKRYAIYRGGASFCGNRATLDLANSLAGPCARPIEQIANHREVDLEGQTVRSPRPRFITKDSRRVWEIREAGGTLSRPRERRFSWTH